MRVIVTGGGTGGHIYPALAIADRIKLEYPNAEIIYIGTPNSLEEAVLKEYPYEFFGIGVKGFQRKISIENFKRAYLAWSSVRKAKKIIKQFNPDLVIGTGGYVSGPVVYAASMCNIKTIIHEQNAYPGLTNKILSKRADIIYLGFEEAKGKFNTKSKIKVVGNIVREGFLSNESKSEARENLGITHKKFILVSGGSGGSLAINREFRKIIPKLVNDEIGFIFSTGKVNFEDILSEYNNIADNKNYTITEYITNMPEYMIASDLCVISAGATTIAEVNSLGRASIVVPKSYTAENHQVKNAESIENAGAGISIKDSELTSDVLYDKIKELLSSDDRILDMEVTSKKMYDHKPLEEIMEDIKEFFEEK